MSEWRAGFAKPWIEWNGVEGEAAQVFVDGEPVPLTEAWCDSGGTDHDVWHDHCVPPDGGEPIGFSWAMPLENRLWVEVLVDEHQSLAHLRTLPRGDHCPVNLSLRMDPPTAWLCPNNYADNCPTDGHRSWDLGDAESWAEFDSYGSLMAHVRAWSGLTVRTDAPRVCGVPKRGGAPPRAQPAVNRRRAAGTVTRDEYEAGERPAWWTE